MAVLLNDEGELNMSESEDPPWGISDFSSPSTLLADAKRIVDDVMNGKPWVPTEETLKQDAENTAKAKAEMEKLREPEREEVLIP